MKIISKLITTLVVLYFYAQQTVCCVEGTCYQLYTDLNSFNETELKNFINNNIETLKFNIK